MSSQIPNHLPSTQSSQNKGIREQGLFARLNQVCQVIYEIFIKDISFVIFSVINYFYYKWNPHIYGLNPKIPTLESNRASIVLLLPGDGGGPHCFLNIAQNLQEAGINNVYSFALTKTEKNSVPTQEIKDIITHIKEQCMAMGAEGIDVTLIGHSSGAISAAKYIWSRDLDPSVAIRSFINIAGRLKYLDNPFYFFCEDIIPEIQQTYERMELFPNQTHLITIRGSNDGIVPAGSVHVPETNSPHTIEGYAHGGVLIAAETQSIIIDQLSNKFNLS